MNFQRLLPHLLAVAAIVAVNCIYFYPQLSGKVVQQGDIINNKGMAREVTEFREKTGEISYWTGAMFGGMPTYQIAAPQPNNATSFMEKAFNLFFDRPIGYFIAAMIGFYILLLTLGVNHWLSLIGAIAFGLSTNTLILFEAGHTSKVRVIAFAAPVIAGILLTYRNQWLKGGLLFAAAMAISLFASHLQMTYYLFMVIGILVLLYAVDALRNGTIKNFLTSSGVLALGLVVAMACSVDKTWATYEYGKDTMRGKPILDSGGKAATSSSETEGLEWGYAMRWSNGGIDVLSSLIPGVAGGGSAEPVPSGSAVVSDLNKKGARLPADFKAPLYWGDLPFTSGPAYFGITVFFLFFMGLWLVKGPIKWWILAGTALTFMLSMGENLAWFNRLLFDYLPMYNKFRTPNSVLSITAILVPLLGFYALGKVLNGDYTKEEVTKAVYVAGGLTGGLSLFFWLLGPSFFDFNGLSDSQYVQSGWSLDAIISDRKALMRGDGLRSLLLVAGMAGFVWLYLQEKIQKNILFAGLAALTIFDLYSAGRRYLDDSSFVSASQYQSNFSPRPVDQEIMKDPDPNYRVYDMTVDPFNSAIPSYYHKTIGGYHPAKLQRYQDLIDRHISQNNMKVLNMLNAKYFIVQGQDGQPSVRQNPAALGAVWLVDSIITVPNANAEIDALNTFEPVKDVVINQEFSAYMQGLSLQKGGTIQLTSYQPNRLEYEANVPSEQFAVFSEVWYGPGKGWQAYLDGQPVEHIRVNYALRGMRIPAGQHKIEFVFDPKEFRVGGAIATASSYVLLLACLGVFGKAAWDKLNEPVEPEAPASGKRSQAAADRPSNRKKKR